MEKIYTIPVNEAFEESGTCPFCRMKHKLEENEVDLILPYHLNGLAACICFEEGVALCGEINLQSGNDVPLIVTNENVCHWVSHLSTLIVAQFALRKKGRGV